MGFGRVQVPIMVLAGFEFRPHGCKSQSEVHGFSYRKCLKGYPYVKRAGETLVYFSILSKFYIMDIFDFLNLGGKGEKETEGHSTKQVACTLQKR